MSIPIKIALITGITGQDGSYLTELLLSKHYQVHGIIRRASTVNTTRLSSDILSRIHLHYADLTDTSSIQNIFHIIENTYTLKKIKTFEVYNLGAMSHVKVSFDCPEYTANVDALGTLRLLECIRHSSLKNKIKFYQASTSELFGKVQEIPQKETTPFYPRSPYGVAKLYSHWIVKNYREAYNVFACSGILFNHESPRREETFVTRKITLGLGKILRGESDVLVLGNIDSKRDWGHAKDFVYGIWLMLQRDIAEDYILSTNEFHSVREFVEKSFSLKGFQIKWKGSGLNEIGYDAHTKKTLIVIDQMYFRPSEVDELLGDSSKARNELQWEPTCTFDKLIQEMVEHDCI